MRKRIGQARLHFLLLIDMMVALLLTALFVWQPWHPDHAMAEPKIGGTLMSEEWEWDSYTRSYRTLFADCRSREDSSFYSINFTDDLSGKPDNAWDVSADHDGSVWAWTTTRSDDGTHTVYDRWVGSDGIIKLSEDATNLFANTDVIEINFNGAVDTSNVTDMSSMFYNCTELVSLDLSGFETSNVTSMRLMFFSCCKLTSLDLSSFDTSNVTLMTRMFTSCEALTALNLSGFDTRSVTNMKQMFEGASALVSLDITSFDTSNVTDVSRMFADCSSLTEVLISDQFVIPVGSDPFNRHSPIQSLDDCTLVN